MWKTYAQRLNIPLKQFSSRWMNNLVLYGIPNCKYSFMMNACWWTTINWTNHILVDKNLCSIEWFLRKWNAVIQYAFTDWSKMRLHFNWCGTFSELLRLMNWKLHCSSFECWLLYHCKTYVICNNYLCNVLILINFSVDVA